MSMTSREQFEQTIKARFGDSIDYRVCKNSDGEYMAWDMQVAWWAWQAASKASEQQLSESRREFTAANATIHNLELKVEQVVAESAALKSKGREVLNEACKIYEKLNATINSDSGDFIDGQTLHEFQFVLDVETPATDAAIANIQAKGVEMLADKTEREANGYGMDSHDWRRMMKVRADAIEFAAQLRQGAEQ